MEDPSTSSLDAEALATAIGRLHIEHLSLRSAAIEVAPETAFGVDESNITVQLKWGPRRSEVANVVQEGGEAKRLLIVEMGTVVRFLAKLPDGTEPKEDASPLGKIEANFLAMYRISDGPDLDTTAIAEFSKHNVIYHVWSYWRAYISDSLARVQFPPFTLPMFAMKFVKPVEEEK